MVNILCVLRLHPVKVPTRKCYDVHGGVGVAGKEIRGSTVDPSTTGSELVLESIILVLYVFCGGRTREFGDITTVPSCPNRATYVNGCTV